MGETINWAELNHEERMEQIRSRIWFGTQYYRPPGPPEEFWDRDFRQMKETGLEVVRLWLYWRWMERRPGVYFWEETDRLFDLAEKHGLYIHPLLFLESAPEWFIRRHPETWIVDHKGERHYPLNRKSTQIGGMDVCGNHRVTRRYAGRFLRALVRRYRNRHSLMCWDAWNELQLKSVATACGCADCRRGFQDSLRRRYRTVEALNRAMRTGYGAWTDIVPPNGDNDYAPWFAWRRWQARSLARQALWRRQVVQEVDSRQVVMIHMPTKLAIPGRGCGDWDACVPHMDFAGNSSHIQHAQRRFDPADLRTARNTMCAEHRIAVQQSPSVAWACEVSSDTQDDYAPPSLHPDDLAYWFWKPLSLGMKGALAWQYRAEGYGPESWQLGLLEPDGSDSERRRMLGRIIATVRRHEPALTAARPPRPQVGIFTDTDQHLANVVLNSKIEGGRGFYQRCLFSLHDILRQAGLPVAFVQSGAIPAAVKLLLVPRAPAGSPELRKTLEEFLRAGGTALVEGGLANPDMESFQYGERTPGQGLDALFGLREERAVSTYWHGVIPGGDSRKRAARDTEDAWLDMGHGDAARAVDALPKELQVRVRWGGRSFRWAAGFDRRPLRVAGARAIGTFGDGAAAVAFRRVGRGQVFYVGTAASYPEGAAQGGFAAFVRRIAAEAGVEPPLPLKAPAGLTWHALVSGRERFVFAFNHTARLLTATLGGGLRGRAVFGAEPALGGRCIPVAPLGTTVVRVTEISTKGSS